MIGVIRSKPAIIVAIIAGLTAIVFVTQAFSTPTEPESTAIRDYVVSLQRDDLARYTDPKYGFSILLPKDFIVSTSTSGGGEAIIAEHPTFNLGFEIFITQFDSDERLTEKSVHDLVPVLTIRDAVETELSDGTPALRFATEDPALGDTRQLWFAHNGNLFQVVLYSDNSEWLDAWVRKLFIDWTFETQTDSVDPI